MERANHFNLLQPGIYNVSANIIYNLLVFHNY